MEYLIKTNRKNRWTINGKVYAECNPDEQEILNRFFREEKISIELKNKHAMQQFVKDLMELGAMENMATSKEAREKCKKEAIQKYQEHIRFLVTFKH